jgi:hypothetical protein
MRYIPKSLRDQVFKRANDLCEYCQTSQAIVIEMVIDHIIPVAAGGTATLENLCLACASCNTYKRDFLTGIDPLSDNEILLFNPRTQQWQEHFFWSEDGIFVGGKTSVGRATVERLRMNREVIVRARRKWMESGWHPPKTD